MALSFLAVAIFNDYDWLTIFRDWILFSVLIAIAVIDIHHQIIPDELSLGGWVFALVTVFLDENLAFRDALLGGLIGFGVFFTFSYLYFQLTKREGMGGGDIKLMGFLGSALGYQSLWSIIFLSSVIGSLFGAFLLLFSKNESGGLKTAIPFGPFLVLGAVLYYFLGNVWLQYMTPI